MKKLLNNQWIYLNNEDNSSRYVLGIIGEKPIFCFGINPSTAEPNNLDPTLKSVNAISRYNGYDSWIMFNVYPKRDAIFENLDSVIQNKEHLRNLNIIIDTISKYENVDIWVAFGNHLYDRDYLIPCLKDIYHKLLNLNVNWLSIGSNKSGAPKHPLYQKHTVHLSPFDMASYIEKL